MSGVGGDFLCWDTSPKVMERGGEVDSRGCEMERSEVENHQGLKKKGGGSTKKDPTKALEKEKEFIGKRGNRQ